MVLLTIICVLTLLIINFCSNKAAATENTGNLFVSGKGVPQWFKDEIEKTASSVSLFKPIKVFIIEDAGIKYVAIENNEKNATIKLKVFSCLGTQVKADEKKYMLIEKKYDNKDVQLIWPE
jgi:hypothetical protein